MRSGTEIAPDALTVTIGFGASLFDERYGLRPPEKLDADDRRSTATGSTRRSRHGDVLLLISAHNMDTASHALRELLRPTRDALALRWWIDGFQGADRGPRRSARARNLFGFRDGTGQPGHRRRRADAPARVDAGRRDVPWRCG